MYHIFMLFVALQHSVHESKLQKLVIPLPNSKTLRAVSGFLFSSQYHGMAESRCFVVISWNLWFSVSLHLKESFCLISFSSDCAWVSGHAAMTVTHSYLGLATCLNICTRAFQLLMINWLLDLFPQAECSRIKMNSSSTLDLESWEPLQDILSLILCISIAEHPSPHKASGAFVTEALLSCSE